MQFVRKKNHENAVFFEHLDTSNEGFVYNILPGLFCFQRRTNESNAYVYIYTTIIKQLGCKGHSYYNPSKLLHDC